ncbi:hypothetical protein I0584_001690 [Staphylococcus pseudintermedius]|nr:hypothetical protein [Staphylococcus pseudintermedius]EGQ3925442.1 hypothetical protein [Staphylococcus pseudintermedius]EGQ4167417.1 hypothetical protein [Staphylococcus pseudintermedius]EGQ4346688.1 hypothetical protein [Staphylococcus pseudintermedius]EGQ4443528.1 hypothetical protein [Staphylococcus pseudintermedius]
MSEISTTNHYYTKGFGNYNLSEDNFVANQELTVTITLNEYRDLISEKAKSKQKIDDARNDYYKERDKNRKFEEEVKSLKQKIYELQNPNEIEFNIEEELLDD